MPFDAAPQKAPTPLSEEEASPAPAPGALSRAARLRRLAALAAEADPELGEALALMAASGVDLATAAGWGQGWFQHEQRRLRDQAIRDAAATMEGSTQRRARQVATMLARAAACAAPSEPAASILAANGGKPLAYRAITDIISLAVSRPQTE
jgi:hypothetical protein